MWLSYGEQKLFCIYIFLFMTSRRRQQLLAVGADGDDDADGFLVGEQLIFWRPPLTIDLLSHLKLSVVESGAEIARLSVRCQETRRRGDERRQGDKETRRQGDKETRSKGDEEQRRREEKTRRRRGDNEETTRATRHTTGD